MDDPAGDPGDSATGSRQSEASPSASPRLPAPVRRAALAGTGFLTVCVLLTAALSGWIGQRGGEVAIPADTAPAPAAVAAADSSAAQARVAAVQPLLDRRATAVRSGRAADWRATLDPTPAGRAFRERQIAEYDRIRQLPVRGWHYEILETTPLPGTGASSAGAPGTGASGTGASSTGASSAGAGGEAFTARVRLGYRLAADARDVERVQEFTVTRRGGGWVLTAVRREGRAADPWELGPLTVTTGRRSVVVGIGSRQPPSAAHLRRTAQEVDAAAARVDAVWGPGRPATVVVVVPADTEQVAAVLGRSDVVGLEQVAAVTTGDLTRGPSAAGAAGGDVAAAGAADRVVVNPQAYGRLSPLGRRVVLTHEITHVTTRATSRVTLPLWVEEGFASYVAYRGSGLSRSLAAADVLPLVRSGRAGDHLPGALAFETANGPIAPAYADAWLAFDLMARDGADRPVDFYRVAAGSSGRLPAGETAEQTLPAAFRQVLGTDQAAFEKRWRTYREDLAEGRTR